ncbi:hypothetical protein [Bosea sp. (in: a-proteobacteria)]|uniref:hypothetical protein n=1 Tax=Bosea sp. (in: a-proteobacteria) TaxID=1871050 RepID=UPI002633E62C|nr:hypothetical protein [Bosea sp. (in: a-proteobacteria)]MCO5091098.1 hypothetical protein [Bosea sp. (in: a-proteobacteria)]
MARSALMTPEDYLDLLQALPVPGYTGYPGGLVSISSYMSANPQFGGNAKAGKLLYLLQKLTKGKPESALLKQDDVRRVFTGQGLPMAFGIVMSLVNTYRAEIAKDPGFKAYFKERDFLQEMCDGGVFGVDCIGFVGGYMVQAGLDARYAGRAPIDFASVFKPVRSLDQVRKYGAVMLTNGFHVQLINNVGEVKNGRLSIELCQSSSGGPQTNTGVTLTQPHSGGSFLPIDDFRRAKASNQYQAEWEADNRARERDNKPKRSYESFLREKMTVTGRQFGHRDGAIFQLARNGDLPNPVGGSVYVGVVENGGITIRGR